MTDEAIKSLVLSSKPRNIEPGFNYIEYYVEKAIKLTRKVMLKEIGLFVSNEPDYRRY